MQSISTHTIKNRHRLDWILRSMTYSGRINWWIKRISEAYRCMKWSKRGWARVRQKLFKALTPTNTVTTSCFSKRRLELIWEVKRFRIWRWRRRRRPGSNLATRCEPIRWVIHLIILMRGMTCNRLINPKLEKMLRRKWRECNRGSTVTKDQFAITQFRETRRIWDLFRITRSSNNRLILWRIIQRSSSNRETHQDTKEERVMGR